MFVVTVVSLSPSVVTVVDDSYSISGPFVQLLEYICDNNVQANLLLYFFRLILEVIHKKKELCSIGLKKQNNSYALKRFSCTIRLEFDDLLHFMKPIVKTVCIYKRRTKTHLPLPTR
jgi:hypothetical protein